MDLLTNFLKNYQKSLNQIRVHSLLMEQNMFELVQNRSEQEQNRSESVRCKNYVTDCCKKKEPEIPDDSYYNYLPGQSC